MIIGIIEAWLQKKTHQAKAEKIRLEVWVGGPVYFVFEGRV